MKTLSFGERLEHVISFTNEYVADIHGDANMFATVFAGILDLDQNILHYINCGNEPPLLVRSGRVVDTLTPSGPVIGVIPGAAYEVKEIAIKPGDLLIAFTDGITDSKNSSEEFFGTARLIETIQRLDTAPVDLLNKVYERLLQFSGTAEQFDDITLLAMRRVC